MRELFRRMLYLGRRNRFDAEMDAEVEFHIETRAEELRQSGMPQAAARMQARREFGPGARMREETRSAWQLRWLEDLLADLRYAARALRRNPAFAATTIACLALGIGANTTMFSIATEVLFSQPSVRDPETLVYMSIGGRQLAGLKQYQFLRDAKVFDDLGGENEEYEVNWRHGDTTDRLFAVRVTDSFFEVTGIPVALGRPIATGDETSAVLSYGFWQRRMRGDPGVVGGSMILDGRVYTVAGVLPRDHRTVTGFGYAPDLYLTVPTDKSGVGLYGRLPRGLSRQAARAKLHAACEEMDRVLPDGNHKWSGEIKLLAVAGIDRIRDDRNLISIATFFAMLMVVAGLVLLIACANVASLLLARSSSRSQELSIRLSIGAGRGRLVRQFLTESLLLALCGAAVGLALNLALTSSISRIHLPLPLPLQYLIQPDWRLLSYSAAVAVGTCLAAGLLPAVKSVRTAMHASLNRHEARGHGWLRNTLVVGQLAVSIVLLCAGFLFLRNLVHASTMSPGFDLTRTIWSHMRVLPEEYTNPAKTRLLVETAVDRLRGLPGVEYASVARVVPLNDNMSIGTRVRTDVSEQAVEIDYKINYVGPDYFRTMQIPILRGREFLVTDRRGGPSVVIVNENLARTLFGQTDPVGHSIRFDWGTSEVVGVAKNSKYFTLGENQALALYEPYSRLPGNREDLHFLVRSSGPPETLAPAIQGLIGSLDPTAATETRPMSKATAFAMLPSRFGAAILGSMGVLGLVLASIGLYGVLLYSVSRRTHEIGLRMALGASPRSVLSLVTRHSLGLVAAGLAIGMTLAVFAVRPLAMFLLPEISATGAANFVVVGVVLCTVALVATLSPALRAMRVDPVVALRHD